jgi:hypothetical protein
MLLAASCAFALAASAQSINNNTPSATAPGDMTSLSGTGYGLLGQDYAGLEFGYTHHVDGPPSVLHRYGFIANRPAAPMSSGVNVDAMFKYNYTTGSDSGLHAWEHDALIGARGFLNFANVKPFVEGNAGWAWTNNNFKTKNDSFAYVLGTGAEFQVGQRVAVAPYVNYEEMPHFHSHEWSYGAKASLRVAREWSAILGGEMDEDHNIEYRVGWNRHF